MAFASNHLTFELTCIKSMRYLTVHVCSACNHSTTCTMFHKTSIKLFWDKEFKEVCLPKERWCFKLNRCYWLRFFATFKRISILAYFLWHIHTFWTLLAKWFGWHCKVSTQMPITQGCRRKYYHFRGYSCREWCLAWGVNKIVK
jgi:hypothetical protein